jgi:transcriptional regulator with XRE-family HTH domain
MIQSPEGARTTRRRNRTPFPRDGIGARIRERRKVLGLTQEELAAYIRSIGGKATQTGIAMLEKRGSSRPRFLKEIARVLNVTPYWLKTGRAGNGDARFAAPGVETADPIAALKRAAHAFAEIRLGTALNSNEHGIATAAEADARKVIAQANEAMT